MRASLKRDLRRARTVVIVLIVVFGIIRLALPYVLKSQINRRLADIGPYAGHVDDVGVHVLHGGYSMAHLVIRKKTAPPNEEAFVQAKDLTFTLSYKDLLHGALTSDIKITEGAIDFENSPAPQAKQDLGSETTAKGAPKPSESWQQVVKDLFPVKIGHLELIHSRLRYVDQGAKPPFDLRVDDLELTANGLQNRPDPKTGPVPAMITANGVTIGKGKIHLVIHVEPLADEPHFDLWLALEGIDLTALNPFLRSSANVDVGRGTMDLYAQINASDGSYKGYVKPILTDLDFHDSYDKKRPPLQLLWKDVVAAVTRLMRDKHQKQVATVVPFEGKFASTKTISVADTIRVLFYNGFVEALHKGLEANPSSAEKGKMKP